VPASDLRCRTLTFFGKNCADNIALCASESNDEEVLAAARLSGVESFIAAIRWVRHAHVRGRPQLSGGQKQAIGLGAC